MKKFDQINVIPFIDIMLVLLAIVLMTATFISQGKITIDVPKSDASASLSADDISIVITLENNGTIYYNDNELSIEALEERLMTLDKTQVITMRVDAKVDFQEFISVTDILYQQGLNKVNVVTEKLP